MDKIADVNIVESCIESMEIDIEKFSLRLKKKKNSHCYQN